MTSALVTKVGWAVGGVILGALLALAMLDARPDSPVEPTSFAARVLPDVDRQSASATKPESTARPTPHPESLKEILQIPGDFAQTAALYQLAMGLGEARILELLDEARTLRPAREGRAASAILYSRYAELDPEAAVDRVLLLGGSNQTAGLAQVFHIWAGVDLDAALARALSLGMQERLVVGMAILQSRDGLSGVERESIARQLGLAGVLPQLEAQRQLSSVDDPVAAWSTAIGMRNRLEQSQRLQMLAEVWARMDPSAAMAAVESLDRADLREQLQRQVARHWVANDAEGAVEWVLAQPQSQNRSSLITSTLALLAANDPARALELTDVLTGAERQQAVAGVLGAWSRVDPRSAAESMAAIQDAATRGMAVARIARSYAQQYPDEAAQWLTELDPAEADQAAVGIVRTLARNDPVAASTLVLGITDSSLRRTAASQLVNNWARIDPEQAVRWASEVDEPELRAQLYKSVLPQWAVYDANAALSYVNRIGGLQEREAAVTAVMISVRDPVVKERLYEGLTLPDSRRNAARQLYHYFLRADPDRAGAYQRAAGISDAEAAEMSTQSSNYSVIRNESTAVSLPRVVVESR